jgi:two-component system sensor histidine kinase DegS
VVPYRPGSVPTSQDTLPAIIAEAERELASTEARLHELLDRATALASQADAERGQLQRFLEEFALERAVYDEPPPAPSAGSGPLIDLRALRLSAQALTDDLNQSSALRRTLATAAQVVRGCRDQFAPGRALQPLERSDDVTLRHAMNAAREDERRRLAREVHDGPAQVLANAIFAIDLAAQIAKRTPDQVGDELGRLRTLLKDGVAEIRRFMFDLRPTMLEDQDLAATLRHVVAEYTRFFAIRVDLDLQEPLPPLSRDEDLAIFRIVQEGLQNVRKHAQTDRARINLRCAPGHLILRIEDDGPGFDPASIVPRPGAAAGLTGLRERARLIGAEVSVESTPGTGTSVVVSLPVRPNR